MKKRERERHAQFFCCLKEKDRERERTRTRKREEESRHSFRWVNNERLRLPRHTYGTTSNKQTNKLNSKKKEVMFMIMMIHGIFVVDLNYSSIFDEFLEYVDLINVLLEIILDFLFEMMISMYLILINI